MNKTDLKEVLALAEEAGGFLVFDNRVMISYPGDYDTEELDVTFHLWRVIQATKDKLQSDPSGKGAGR